MHGPSKAGSSELATKARATGIALQPVIDDFTTKGSHVQSDADIEDDTLSPSVVPRQERIGKLVEEACGRQECASAEILGPAGLTHLQVRLFGPAPASTPSIPCARQFGANFFVHRAGRECKQCADQMQSEIMYADVLAWRGLSSRLLPMPLAEVKSEFGRFSKSEPLSSWETSASTCMCPSLPASCFMVQEKVFVHWPCLLAGAERAAAAFIGAVPGIWAFRVLADCLAASCCMHRELFAGSAC